MIWIKSVLVGMAAAILTIVVVLVATLAWAINVNMGDGSGGIGAVSVGIIELVLLPAMIGFVVGFWWSVRRQRRKHSLISAL